MNKLLSDMESRWQVNARLQRHGTFARLEALGLIDVKGTVITPKSVTGGVSTSDLKKYYKDWLKTSDSYKEAVRALFGVDKLKIIKS